MKKKDLVKLLVVCMLWLPITVCAQQMNVSKFILPDGMSISRDKLDSVRKAWNGERIMFQHNEEDDKNHVMHLVRLTPEMGKMLQEEDEKRQHAMKAMIGQPAPAFSLKDLNGKFQSLAALKGKVVVLNFWFTSCPPCLQEMPSLNDLVKRYKDNDVVFLALTFNNERDVREFLNDHAFAYTILPSSRQIDKKYQITLWPTSFIIGRDGNVSAAINFSENVESTLSAGIDIALK
ncbi:TlpA family protein disulfide reductase [Mucilaginibacter agri]|uniref:Redoxin domain-containing protein n=1 Tax=Mucilaginibacter agri TaxID=2695265 RepID=A0A965ZJS0_9SPHI|nr:TlpA disulfide reductase family protein [Mucilaginibacter agri]NCD72435.1 redoxin domain-containing protein [Mucilaginibacter agri]